MKSVIILIILGVMLIGIVIYLLTKLFKSSNPIDNNTSERSTHKIYCISE